MTPIQDPGQPRVVRRIACDFKRIQSVFEVVVTGVEGNRAHILRPWAASCRIFR